MKETERLDYDTYRCDDVDKETHGNGGIIGLCINILPLYFGRT